MALAPRSEWKHVQASVQNVPQGTIQAPTLLLCLIPNDVGAFAAAFQCCVVYLPWRVDVMHWRVEVGRHNMLQPSTSVKLSEGRSRPWWLGQQGLCYCLLCCCRVFGCVG